MASSLSIEAGTLRALDFNQTSMAWKSGICVFVLTLAGALLPAWAQTVVAPAACTVSDPLADSERAQAAQRFVEEKLALWRQRLKLEDWRVSVVMAQQSDLAPKTLGAIKWDKAKKSAVIYVLGPSEYRLPFCGALEDMELTVVHELLHLELTSLPRGQASRSSEEHAVNGIAEAMLGLDRKRP
jgi:hypothetical protein